MEEYIQQRIGQTLGERWLLESVLGVGGMAAVYAARDSAGNEAAVKVLHPEIGMRAEVRDRFMREGYVANKIQHPGVVRVLEHGAVDDWSVFLVMERLVGESLAERVTRHGTLPLDELLGVLDQVLDVLGVAHAAGIVHRDLKPDNLYVLADGRIKVLDFGLARVLESAPDDVRTRTGMAMGTMPYMAPEQALGKRAEIDGRVDLFALGATAFRIIARRKIHESDSDAGLLVAMATQPAPALKSVAPHVPEAVAKVVDLALAFNRDARYPDARQMQADVRALRQGQAPSFALARLQSTEEATKTHGSVAAAVAPPSSGKVEAPSAAVTVVAPLGTPTVVASAAATSPAPVAAIAEASQAPTVVASLGAPTVVAPIQQPTQIGLGGSEPGPPASAGPPTGSASLPGEAASSQISMARSVSAPRRKLALLGVLALAASAAGAVGWLAWPTTETSPDTLAAPGAGSPGPEADVLSAALRDREAPVVTAPTSEATSRVARVAQPKRPTATEPSPSQVAAAESSEERGAALAPSQAGEPVEDSATAPTAVASEPQAESPTAKTAASPAPKPDKKKGSDKSKRKPSRGHGKAAHKR